MNKIKDKELREYQKQIGREEYGKMYRKLYTKAVRSPDKRFSGKKYVNNKDRLKAIKEKYKNGITNEILEEINGALTV